MSEDKLDGKRIFINHIDTFIGKNLAQFLRKCVIGSSLDEVNEEEEIEGEIEGDFPTKDLDSCYEIHGTLLNKSSNKPYFVQSILKYDTKEEFFEHLIEFDVIIYNVFNDINQIEEALWVANKLHESFQWLEKEITFIFLSTIMTWAKTKPADPDDIEYNFSEEDIKRRKPHPNFKDQFNAEKEIMKLSKKHKSKIKTYVVVSGLLYGSEEDIFHNYFKQAWNNSEYLTVYGSGSNVLPTIHINDLAGILQNIADKQPENRYILAVDESKNTLEDIVKIISETLSNGKIKFITKEQALVENSIQQHDLELLMTDLRIDAGSIKDEMNIKWAAEAGIIEAIYFVVNEYKTSRNLTALKVCIIGPCGSGKSYYSERIAFKYQLKHLKIYEIISKFMEDLDKKIEYPTTLIEEIELEKSKMMPDSEETIDANYRAEEVEEAENNASSANELKERLLKNMEENNGQLFDEDLILIYKDCLLNKECINHGYVLDGFPETKEQAIALFASDSEEDEDFKNPKFNDMVIPQFAFLIKASDNFLINRFAFDQKNNNIEYEIHLEEFKQKLHKYRAVNDDVEAIDEDTLITYFDLREIHPIILDLKEDLTKEFDIIRTETFEKICYELGTPHIYSFNDDELCLIKLRVEEDLKHKQVIENENKKIKEAEMLTIRKHNQNEWNENLDLVKKEMYEYLETQSLPLRNYLMHLVMPVLTEGLMDCSKVRTEDPIDFLSEFIIRHTTQSFEESETDI